MSLLNCSYLPQRHASIEKQEALGVVPHSSGGKSDIVFVRTSLVASAVEAHLYKVSGDTPEYVATMPNNTKLEYTLSPGRHIFMLVSGNSVDFIRVDAGTQRTYYSLVEPHMGVWKPSFSIQPVKLKVAEVVTDRDEVMENNKDKEAGANGIPIVEADTGDVTSKVEAIKIKLNDAKWIVASDQTPPNHDANINARYREAWRDWLKKSAKERDKKTLNAMDGVIGNS
ncbi:MAG: hypothetical protein K6L80_14690 [Agarilytica sp.]